MYACCVVRVEGCPNTAKNVASRPAAESERLRQYTVREKCCDLFWKKQCYSNLPKLYLRWRCGMTTFISVWCKSAVMDTQNFIITFHAVILLLSENTLPFEIALVLYLMYIS